MSKTKNRIPSPNPNREIAGIFNTMADILEIAEVAWKPRAYRNAARSLEMLGRSVRDIYQERGLQGLEEIEGIGEGLGKKIVQYLGSGRVPEFERLKRTLPQGVTDLMNVPGLGPYRAENLYHHHIRSVDDLKKAISNHRLSDLPGFGPKSEKKIAENLGLLKPHGDRRTREEVLPIAQKLAAALGAWQEVDRIELVGSLRRKEATIGDIDLLVISTRPQAVMDAFASLPSVQKVILHGSKKSEVLLKDGLQVDLRVFEAESFGAAMIYFTGNKRHNIALRRIAIQKGFKLNEYGLFDRQGRRMAGGTEEGVYSALGFRWIPPEKRQGQDELTLFRSKRPS